MTRRFDEREVAELLRRATEPKSGGSLARSGSGSGLTLEEVKDIAVEAGIDPARIDEAVAALGRPAPSSKLDAFVGAPTNVRFEAEYAVALDEGDHTELIRLIRAALGRQGVVGGRGADLEWMDQDGLGSRNVNVYRTAGGTRIEILGRFREAGSGAAGITGVLGGAGAVAAWAAIPAGPAGLLVVPLALAGMYAVPRLTIGRTVRQETRRLADLAERIRELMASRERDLAIERSEEP